MTTTQTCQVSREVSRDVSNNFRDFYFEKILAACEGLWFDADAIPAGMIATGRRFGFWGGLTAEGKINKIPRQVATSKRSVILNARNNDPRTWGGYRQALQHLIWYAKENPDEKCGPGFFIYPEDGISLVEFDDGIDDQGRIKPWAQQILDAIRSWAEYSVSGRGIHIYFCGRLNIPDGKKWRIFTVKDESGVEQGKVQFHSWGFFALTGHQVPGTPNDLTDCGEAAQQLLDWYAENDTEKRGAQEVAASTACGLATAAECPPDDAEIIRRACEGINGANFAAMHYGGWTGPNNDRSEADFAYWKEIAYWVGDDPGRIEAIFLRSALLIDRPDKETKYFSRGNFLQEQIKKAIAEKRTFYRWGGRTKSSKPAERQSGLAPAINVRLIHRADHGLGSPMDKSDKLPKSPISASLFPDDAKCPSPKLGYFASINEPNQRRVLCHRCGDRQCAECHRQKVGDWARHLLIDDDPNRAAFNKECGTRYPEAAQMLWFHRRDGRELTGQTEAYPADALFYAATVESGKPLEAAIKQIRRYGVGNDDAELPGGYINYLAIENDDRKSKTIIATVPFGDAKEIAIPEAMKLTADLLGKVTPDFYGDGKKRPIATSDGWKQLPRLNEYTLLGRPESQQAEGEAELEESEKPEARAEHIREVMGVAEEAAYELGAFAVAWESNKPGDPGRLSFSVPWDWDDDAYMRASGFKPHWQWQQEQETLRWSREMVKRGVRIVCKGRVLAAECAGSEGQPPRAMKSEFGFKPKAPSRSYVHSPQTAT